MACCTLLVRHTTSREPPIPSSSREPPQSTAIEGLAVNLKQKREWDWTNTTRSGENAPGQMAHFEQDISIISPLIFYLLPLSQRPYNMKDINCICCTRFALPSPPQSRQDCMEQNLEQNQQKCYRYESSQCITQVRRPAAKSSHKKKLSRH